MLSWTMCSMPGPILVWTHVPLKLTTFDLCNIKVVYVEISPGNVAVFYFVFHGPQVNIRWSYWTLWQQNSTRKVECSNCW